MFTEFKRLVLIIILFFVATFSYSQGLGNSPYSRIGLGDGMNYQGTIRNMGMGYAGSSLMSREYMNLLNPAGLANFRYRRNDSLVKIDVGFTIQFKTLKNDQIRSTSNGANINHIAFTFPVSKLYTTGIVLAPLTIVQNNYNYQAPVSNDPNGYSAKYNYVGDGGIYQFRWMNGVGLTKNLSVGMTAAFNFGNITQEATSQLITDPSRPDLENEVGSKRKTVYSGLSFKPGVMYEKQLYRKTAYTYKDPYGVEHDSTRSVPTPIFFRAGASAEFFSNIKATETRDLFVRNPKNQVTTDSLLTETTGRAYFPTTLRIGTSFEKPGHWTVAADMVYTDWSNYSKNVFKNDSLNPSSIGLYLGGEFIPQFDASKEHKKLYRAHRVRTYRAGFMYTATPIAIDGHRLYDYSFSIGASIPVGVRNKTDQSRMFVPLLPKVNVAFVAGQRSTFASNQLTETYYRIQLSMVIYDNWFFKRRIQ